MGRFFDFPNVKKALAELTGNVKTLRDEIEQLKRQREEIAEAPAARQDVIRLLHSNIDSMAANYPNEMREGLAQYIASSNTADIAQHLPLFLLPRGRHGQSGMLPASFLRDMVFILGPQFKDGIARAIEAMDWPADAISLAERSKRLATLDEKITALEREEGEIRQAAASAGISL